MQGLLIVYSSASDVSCRSVLLKLLSQPAPSFSHGKYFVSHCLISVKVPGGCRPQGCRGYHKRSVQTACGFILSGTIPQANLLSTS